jgi:hypothetical protein
VRGKCGEAVEAAGLRGEELSPATAVRVENAMAITPMKTFVTAAHVKEAAIP